MIATMIPNSIDIITQTLYRNVLARSNILKLVMILIIMGYSLMRWVLLFKIDSLVLLDQNEKIKMLNIHTVIIYLINFTTQSNTME